MDFDLNAFYRERDSIVNQPDEDLNDYRKRILVGSTESHFIQEDHCMSLAPFPEEEEDVILSCLNKGRSGNAPTVSPREPIVSTSDMEPKASLGHSSGVKSPLLRSVPQLKTSTTSRVQESSYHNQMRTPQSYDPPAGRQPPAPSSAGQPGQVSGLVAIEGENVEGMHDSDTRIDKIGIKRKPSLIQSTSPAKRSRTDEDRPIWNDFSIPQTSIPSFASHKPLPLSGNGESAQITRDAEQPSEILSFTLSPRRSQQGSPSAAGSSPINSFSRIMARSPSSGLRQDQKQVQKPGSIPKFPYGPLYGGAASKRKQVDNTINWNKRDEEDPPTSPIEDPSIHESLTPAASEKPRRSVITSDSSSLCLEVKERVARHVTMKQQDRAILLKVKITDAPSSSGPAIRKEPYFNGATDISDVSAGPVPRTVASSHDSEAERSAKLKAIHRSRIQPKVQKSKSAKKEKQAPVSPIEYAKHVLERIDAANKSRNSNSQFLEGKYIFYIGGDMQYAGERTRKRMDLIVKYGGNLVPVYDPSVVTHIVTDTNKQPTLRALSCKRLSDIPSHIPTVKWDWISSGINRLSRLDKEDIKTKLEDVWMYAAFGERMDTTKHSKSPISLTPSHILTQGLSSPGEPEDDPTSHRLRTIPSAVRIVGSTHDVQNDQSSRLETSSPGISVDKGMGFGRVAEEIECTKQNAVDPLEEFYAEAREASENKLLLYGDYDESDGELDQFTNDTVPLIQRPERGWTCDSKELQQTQCANQDIIEKLQELQELHKAKLGEEDHWRAYSYNKSIRAIRGYPKRIQSHSEARSIRGVGDKTALKIMEILQTGDLRRINYERTDDVEVTRLFQGIYGVGQSTAFKWYSSGCRTLDDLRNQKGGVRLNSVQLIGLQYYDDINSRMPRSEAKAIFDLIKPLVLSVDQKLSVEIMGSYRRGKSDCGDIDILITRPVDDDKTHSGILARLLPILHKEGIITEDLAIPEDLKDLECVYRGLCCLPHEGARKRRIDFLTVPWESRGAALLYYTGDDIFNRAMRLKANKMGFSLNQRGLFSGVVRDPRDPRIKSNEGTLLASETEEEIFRILDVPWQEPHERIRG